MVHLPAAVGRRLVPVVAGALLLAAVFAALPEAPPREAVSPVSLERGGGIAMGGPWTWLPAEQQASDLDTVAAAGAEWIRVSFRWSAMQPERDRYDWSTHDRIVRLASDRGLSIIANVAYTPAWARSDGCDHPHCAPRASTPYAEFVEAMVRRYGPYGVRAVEVWNEPNLATFWRPRPDPAAYAGLLDAAGAAVKRVDATIVVVSGGLAPRALDTADNLTPVSFLRAMYASGATAFDAVGVHPYSFPRAPLDPHPTNTFALLPAIHQLMADHGDGDKQIWATEFAYWTSSPDTEPVGGAVSEARQAQYLTEAYEEASARPWMGPLLWFTLRDGEKAFGLLRADGSTKPAFAAFRQAIAPAPVPTSIRVAAERGTERIRVVARLQGTMAGERVVVALARLTDSGWRRVRDTTGLVDADGRLVTSLLRPRAGRCRVRASFSGTATHLPSTATDRLRC